MIRLQRQARIALVIRIVVVVVWCGRVLVRKDVVRNVAVLVISKVLIFQIREGALPLVVVVVVGVAREVVVVVVRVVVEVLVEAPVGLVGGGGLGLRFLGRVELREGVVFSSDGVVSSSGVVFGVGRRRRRGLRLSLIHI